MASFLKDPLFCVAVQVEAGRGSNCGDSGDSKKLSTKSPPGWKKLTATRLSSPSNPFVKHCVKLRLSSSYRRSCGAALVVGLTPIMEVCRFQVMNNEEPLNIDCLLLIDGVESPVTLNIPSTSIIHVSSHVFKKISGVQSIESIGAIAIMKFPSSFYNVVGECEDAMYPSCFPLPKRVLALDGIQDPGNLGTLLRSAMAFKWDVVFLLPNCCDLFNEKALRAGRGASFQLPIVCGSWLHLEALCRRFRLKMLAGHPENHAEPSIRASSLSKELADLLAGRAICLVLGSEGRDMADSLNVSVAGGIFLYMLQPEKYR
ncbi:hypothetical protein HPP92_014172 [Vanilla planifolia]|uniref:tRNA/rRNA methyltransferase SpoU type domain-containing protein n=1 Tax=Vanilla planifolia TaxID=51239 RepID=A0A835QUF6_VANPL|nr:hypothetical protein HPP92_014172 [Vanilla planifolia]